MHKIIHTKINHKNGKRLNPSHIAIDICATHGLRCLIVMCITHINGKTKIKLMTYEYFLNSKQISLIAQDIYLLMQL